MLMATGTVMGTATATAMVAATGAVVAARVIEEAIIGYRTPIYNTESTPTRNA
jgi:hypothetical protein